MLTFYFLVIAVERNGNIRIYIQKQFLREWIMDKEDVEKDSLASYVLTNVIPVLDIIFHYLHGKTLNSCSQVCSIWYDHFKREKGRRKFFETGLMVATTWEKV